MPQSQWVSDVSANYFHSKNFDYFTSSSNEFFFSLTEFVYICRRNRQSDSVGTQKMKCYNKLLKSVIAVHAFTCVFAYVFQKGKKIFDGPK